MKNVTSKIGLTALAVSLPQLLMAAEANTPPWRGVVNADDSSVFSVLIALSVILVILIWVLSGIISSLGSDKSLWSSKGTKTAALLTLLGGSVMIPSSAMAANTSFGVSLLVMSDSIFWMLVVFNLFLALVVFVLLANLRGMINNLKAEEDAVEEVSAFDSAITGLRPISEEKDLLMDHEYDGIHELDNNLPPWWLYMFYACILFSLIYIPYYHMGSGQTQDQEFNTTMAQANEEKAARLAKLGSSVDENNVTLLTDASAVSAGEELFGTYCVACHNKGAMGTPTSVGPNLTDEFWIHGGGIKNVFNTVKYGVPQKGMISWQTQMNPVQMQQVSSYILSVAGTDNGTGKEPQGDKWTDGDGAVSADATEETTNGSSSAEGELKAYEQLTDATGIGAGKKVYDAMCLACHGAEGQGGVGPNFADEYWVHGGDMAHIMEIIRVGNPMKGMIAWEAQLTEEERQQVASYILTFQGTEPANGKAPEGEKWEN